MTQRFFFLLLFYFLSTFNGKINAKMRIVTKMRMKIKKSCQCSITDSGNSDDHCITGGVYGSMYSNCKMVMCMYVHAYILLSPPLLKSPPILGIWTLKWEGHNFPDS